MDSLTEKNKYFYKVVAKVIKKYEINLVKFNSCLENIFQFLMGILNLKLDKPIIKRLNQIIKSIQLLYTKYNFQREVFMSMKILTKQFSRKCYYYFSNFLFK